MENQKNNKMVIVLLVVIIVILSVLCVLFATGTISFNTNKINNNNTNENANDNNQTDNTVNNNDNQNEQQWTAYQQCGGVIYYNPVTNKQCNKDENGCFGWYVISKDTQTDSKLEVILNKNLGETVALNENGNPDEGPITALNYLKSQTKDWIVEVRMPTISDVASILNVEKNNDGNIGVLEVPACLYSNGDSRENWDGGYWLADYEKSKPVFIIDCSRGLISPGNQFIKSDPTNSGSWGVRPVITVDKSVLH